MTQQRRFALIVASVSLLAISLAACGSSDSSGSSSSDSTSASAATVSVQSVGGTDVLVDSDGNALYTNDQDSGGTVKCTGQCTTIWPPLEAPSGSQPSSDDSTVNGQLGTTDRPDGTEQVTFGGKPLYTFTQDTPGQDNGDGATDSFGGVSFSWTVASAGGDTSGSEGSGSSAPTTTDSGSGGAGSYGY